MGTLLLIRHGRTDANATGVLAGRAPGVVLDEVGRTTTESLAKRLEAVKIAQVVSSPLERTLETASILFAKDVEVALEDRLQRVIDMLVKHCDRFCAAMEADFGGRSPVFSMMNSSMLGKRFKEAMPLQTGCML